MDFPVWCLHERFAQQAAQQPGAIAVVCGEESLTYAELDTRANQLAHHLRQLGVGPDVLVGVCLEQSVELVVGMLGILKAGGAYVPLDPRYPAERLAFMVSDARATVIVTQAGLAERLPKSEARLVRLDADWPSIAGQPADAPETGVSPEDLAYVMYTSGSTGQPKGVMVSHANVARLFTATHGWFGFDASDVWTLFHSYAFDFSVWEVWGALAYGGRLIVVPYLVSRTPSALVELLRRTGVTVLNQTPSAFRQFEQAEALNCTEAGSTTLRYIIFGGEALDPRSLRAWMERHGDERPRLVNMYGITETTVHVTYRELRRSDVETAVSPIGVPIPDLRVYVLDEHGQQVPRGAAGELYVGGAGRSAGLPEAARADDRAVCEPLPARRLEREAVSVRGPCPTAN